MSKKTSTKTVDIVVGLQWGDEGKGKIIDYLLSERTYRIVARFQGGPNAGHSLKVGNTELIMHQIPSGILHQKVTNIIGPNVLVDPIVLIYDELEQLKNAGVTSFDNLVLSSNASLIIPTHILLDFGEEDKKGATKIGTTYKGIGPAIEDKRRGLKIRDILRMDFKEKYHLLRDRHLAIAKGLGYPKTFSTHGGKKFSLEKEEKKFFSAIEHLSTLRIEDTTQLLHYAIQNREEILLEGAQGTMLDVNLGQAPNVTSSQTVATAALSDLGIAHHHIRHIYGVMKAYCTRVGSGDFPTELHDDIGKKIQEVGKEVGATTGRPRRCGWLDIPMIEFAIAVNGITHIALTKADILSVLDEVQVCDEYLIGKGIGCYSTGLNPDWIKPIYQSFAPWESLFQYKTLEQSSNEFKMFIDYLEHRLGVPVSIISNGPARDQIITRN